jgi:hypothetical protein
MFYRILHPSVFSVVLCLLQRFGIAVFIVATSLSTSSCELIVLKDSKFTPAVIEVNQTSPQGAVYVFKQEIDSSNVQGALKVMASDDERPLLAVEKLEMQDEIARLGRIILRRDITNMHVDTLSPVRQRIRTEFGYLKELTFFTIRIDSTWFISKVLEK